MILAVDVDYKDKKANVAALVFEHFPDESAISFYTNTIDNIAEYQAGEFYKRELPCILEILKIVKEKIGLIIVDGYVWLDSNKKPGLGAYLYNALDGKIPVIGVAKRSFYHENNKMKKIFRGKSDNPLFVTSEGLDIETAASNIKNMHGMYRIPTLLKKVDGICRNWEQEA